MDSSLAQRVANANKEIYNSGLVQETWGNASTRVNKSKSIIIKPSGIAFDKLNSKNMVEVDITGKHIGAKKPSSDTQTHIFLYNAFPEIGGIVHTHSHYATVFAQVPLQIPILGTTHADCFRGNIPLAKVLTKREIEIDYERNTGKSIVETLNALKYAPLDMPAILIPYHGVFTWGKDVEDAVANARIVEEVAKLAYDTMLLRKGILSRENNFDTRYLFGKHWNRKHGRKKYYGQEARGKEK